MTSGRPKVDTSGHEVIHVRKRNKGAHGSESRLEGRYHERGNLLALQTVVDPCNGVTRRENLQLHFYNLVDVRCSFNPDCYSVALNRPYTI